MVQELKIQRVRSGIKQYRLAQLVNITQSELSAFETGRKEAPSEVKQRLSDVLCIEVGKLFPEPEDQKVIA